MIIRLSILITLILSGCAKGELSDQRWVCYDGRAYVRVNGVWALVQGYGEQRGIVVCLEDRYAVHIAQHHDEYGESL